MATTKGYSCDEGLGLYIAKRGCVSKHPPFFYLYDIFLTHEIGFRKSLKLLFKLLL